MTRREAREGVARGLLWAMAVPAAMESRVVLRAEDTIPAPLSVSQSARFVPVTCSQTAGSRSSASGQAVRALPVA